MFIQSLLHSASFKKHSTLSTIARVLNVFSKPRFRYRALINMNNKKAVTLDILVIYDTSLFSIIQAMSAKQYFETRGQLFRDNQSSLTIATWDVMAGKASDRYRLKVGPRAIAIIAFASYEGEDQPHRLVIPPDTKDIMILLNEKTLLLAENGVDYMDVGPKREFTVIKKIQEQSDLKSDNVIPSGYGNFYTLDGQDRPPAVVKKRIFNPRSIKKVENIPVRIDSMNTTDIHKNYHLPNGEGDYFKAKFSNFYQLMSHKLKQNLFSHNGMLDNKILELHGINFFYSTNMNIKYCDLQVKIFLSNQYRYFAIMSELYGQFLKGREGYLENGEYNGNMGNNSKGTNGNDGTNGTDKNGVNGGGGKGSDGEGGGLGKNSGNDKDVNGGGGKGNSNNNDPNNKNGANDAQNQNKSDKNGDGNNDKSSANGSNGKNGGDGSSGSQNGSNPNGSGSLGLNLNGGMDRDNKSNPLSQYLDKDRDDSNRKDDRQFWDNKDKDTDPSGDVEDKKKPSIPSLPIGSLGRFGALSNTLSKLSFWSKVARVAKRGVDALRKTHRSTKVNY